jgi:uncharacterized protein YndB with AHSA1/START domain
MNREDLTLDVEQRVDVKAAPGDVYRGLLHRLAEGNIRPDGKSLQMVFEPWPGGRWFRDLGSGTGHLWCHVQVIKPPTLIEMCGPMFMSYPALNHVEIKLEPVAGGTSVSIRHRAIGFLDDFHRQGLGAGWQHVLDSLKQDFA